MTWMWAAQHRLEDGRWRPFAVSAVVTLLVAGMYTHAVDAVLVWVWQVENLAP